MLQNSVISHRIKQTIYWYGTEYQFYRLEKNEYQEMTGEPVAIAKFKALFHNGSSDHIEISTSDAGSVIQKNTPYVMANWQDAKNLHMGDITVINSCKYKVTGITNVNQMDIVGEISLEVIL